MKIRSGFVSNSSSSSFVIIIHEDNVRTCPTCKRSDNYDLEIVQRSDVENRNGESGIQPLVMSDAYKYLWESYEDTKEALERLPLRREDEVPHWFESSETSRVSAYKEHLLEMLRETKENISVYEEAIKSKDSYHLKISNHDNVLKTAFENLVTAKVIEIVLVEDE